MANALALALLLSSSSPVIPPTAALATWNADDTHQNFLSDDGSTNKFEVRAVTQTSPTARMSLAATPSARAMTSRERIIRRRRALRGGQQQAMAGLISLIQTSIAPDCWEYSGGGFSGGNGGAGGNGTGKTRQNTENLAELIQQTTRPLSWEINGGNGSISIFSGN